MLIKQLSIFLENKKGRFTEVANILGEAGINMSAFTVSENSDFGILRLIVSDTDKAIQVLRDHLYAVSVADVVCLHCPNQPGALAKAMQIITLPESARSIGKSHANHYGSRYLRRIYVCLFAGRCSERHYPSGQC